MSECIKFSVLEKADQSYIMPLFCKFWKSLDDLWVFPFLHYYIIYMYLNLLNITDMLTKRQKVQRIVFSNVSAVCNTFLILA
jgi:hypothetical protein